MGNTSGLFTSSADFRNFSEGVEAPLSNETFQLQQIAQQVIGINPNCTPGRADIPLFKNRLDNIGRVLRVGSKKPTSSGYFNQQIGNFFEEAVRRSANLTKYTGKPIASPRRQMATARTGGDIKSAVEPDAIENVVLLQKPSRLSSINLLP